MENNIITFEETVRYLELHDKVEQRVYYIARLLFGDTRDSYLERYSIIDPDGISLHYAFFTADIAYTIELPLHYLWSDDEFIVSDWKERTEAQKRNEELQKQIKERQYREAIEKGVHTLLEELKAKYENN